MKSHSASVFYIVSGMLLLARAAAMVVSGLLLKILPTALGPSAALVYALNLPVVLNLSGNLHNPEGRAISPARIPSRDDINIVQSAGVERYGASDTKCCHKRQVHDQPLQAHVSNSI